jgi:hypothetical protein
MSKWKQEDPNKHTAYMREWFKTEKGLKNKEQAAERSRKWRRENKDKHRAGQIRSYNKIRLEVFNHYGGAVCCCCGEKEIKFLHLDHINGDGYLYRKEWSKKGIMGGTQLYYWLKQNNYPQDIKLQVLCANCNLGKRSGKYCPHELNRGVDMHGNKIPEEYYPLELEFKSRRTHSEVLDEAKLLGKSSSAIRSAKYNARKRLLRTEPPRSNGNDGKLVCKHGHPLDEVNTYKWVTPDGFIHRQCRQCKRDYKDRKKFS